MLELQIANSDVTSGSLAVTWCVDHETLKYLSEFSSKDPQVVIVVAPVENYDSSKEYRKVVPLRDLMTYIEFRVPGANKIWAFLSLQDRKEVNARYLSRDYGKWKTDILGQCGNDWSYIFPSKMDEESGCYKYEPTISAPTIDVNVPVEVFAKEPPEWEKAWVNFLFRGKPIDQCDYRRRRMFAYTVQPVLVSLSLLVRLLSLTISTLWLSRGMSLQYLLHPLSYDLEESFNVFKGGTYALADLPEDNQSGLTELTLSYVIRKLWRLPLMPAICVPLLALWHFGVLFGALKILACVVVFIALVFVIASGLVFDLWDNVKKYLFVEAEEELWYMDQEEMQNIICKPTTHKAVTVSALPAKRRSIKLRVQSLKSKVCRPFSA